MARVDFYVLESGPCEAAEHFVCRLVGRVFAASERLWIRVTDEAAATALDTRLWTFDELSFIPHARPDDPVAGETPILIAPDLPDAGVPSVILNLSEDPVDTLPDGNAVRLLEVVFGDPPGRARGRERWAHYQAAGHTLNVHKINPDSSARA